MRRSERERLLAASASVLRVLTVGAGAAQGGAGWQRDVQRQQVEPPLISQIWNTANADF